MGIKDVTFAFCVDYKKTIHKMKSRNKELVVLTDDEKKKVLQYMIDICYQFEIELRTCCDSGISKDITEIKPAHCIDSSKINELFKRKGLTLHKKGTDSGQREACNCMTTREVGDYDQKCHHSCDYCYANPE